MNLHLSASVGLMRTIATGFFRMQSRNNSFDFARFIAASSVIFGHQFTIAGYDEPFIRGVSIGTIGVSIFFLMSGFLIFKSIQANDDFYRFLSARILRILPNLTFVLVATSIVTIVSFENYANWPLHLSYVSQNLLMIVHGGLPVNITGVFETRPLQNVNASLWTLPYEVWCYFILFGILKFLPAFSRQIILALVALSVWVALNADVIIPATALELHYLGRMGLWFFIGAAFAAFSSNLPLLSSPRFSSFSKWGDPSYGMYIMAWPIQQFTTVRFTHFWLGMLISWLIITALGYATWHIFERKALTQVEPLTAYLKRVSKKRPFRSANLTR
jgi:peptidoglycan/LPS O-acetylase OafA/YrhL